MKRFTMYIGEKVQHVLIYLLAFLIFCFFRCELDAQGDWKGVTTWTFKFHARKFSHGIATILIFPIIILIFGIVGLKNLIENVFLTGLCVSHMDYKFSLPVGDKPSLFSCYKKF